jgi:ribonuclease P protein component
LIRQTFKKGERLRSKKLIGDLFSKGNGFFVYPFKVIYVETSEKRAFPVEVLISVPKKRIKGAVKRNRIKRLVREAYRKNKGLLWDKMESRPSTLLLGLIYVADQEMTYHEIEKKIILILQRINKIYEKTDR